MMMKGAMRLGTHPETLVEVNVLSSFRGPCSTSMFVGWRGYLGTKSYCQGPVDDGARSVDLFTDR